MEKSKLEKLRTLLATKEMMEKAKNIEMHSYSSWRGKYNIGYEHAVFIRCQCLGPFLKIAIFLTEEMRKGNKKARYEIFINPETAEFVTRDFADPKKPKWREAKLDMLEWPDCLWHCKKKKAWINSQGNNSIKRLLKTKAGGFEGILEFQLSTREEELKQRHRRETGPWDEDMERVPELPKDWEQWSQKEGILENFIFYHYKKGGAKSGYCSYCEKEVPISNPKHNAQNNCPSCGKKITYKATGKIKALRTEMNNGQLIQEITEGFVIRTFHMYRYYRSNNYKKPIYSINEFERSIYESGEWRKLYRYELYKNTEMRWVKSEICGYSSYYTGHNGTVYPYNIKELEKTILLRSSLPMILEKSQTVNCVRYLELEHSFPVLERVTKAGLTQLAKDVINRDITNASINSKERELSKALKIDQERLKRLREQNGNYIMLEWLQEEKAADTIYPKTLIPFFVSNKIRAIDIQFIRDRMSVEKIMNYLIRQQESTGEEIRQIITTWKDYLNMAKKAKVMVDKEIIYKPKSLRTKHAEIIALLSKGDIKKQANEVRKKFKKVEKHCSELSKYEFADEKYSVIAPKSVEDIIVEGMTLQHCIHTCDYYFERINIKESYLLFLRRTGEEAAPYYTLEVEPSGNIRQKRTTGDNQNKDFDQAIPFLKKWQKEIKERLTEEDKELGKKSNELRKKELAQLRKKNNKIWNGPLKGKLLADVLEADFMDAEAI